MADDLGKGSEDRHPQQPVPCRCAQPLETRDDDERHCLLCGRTISLAAVA
jgi:hypothetical protein